MLIRNFVLPASCFLIMMTPTTPHSFSHNSSGTIVSHKMTSSWNVDLASRLQWQGFPSLRKITMLYQVFSLELHSKSLKSSQSAAIWTRATLKANTNTHSLLPHSTTPHTLLLEHHWHELLHHVLAYVIQVHPKLWSHSVRLHVLASPTTITCTILLT